MVKSAVCNRVELNNLYLLRYASFFVKDRGGQPSQMGGGGFQVLRPKMWRNFTAKAISKSRGPSHQPLNFHNEVGRIRKLILARNGEGRGGEERECEYVQFPVASPLVKRHGIIRQWSTPAITTQTVCDFDWSSRLLIRWWSKLTSVDNPLFKMKLKGLQPSQETIIYALLIRVTTALIGNIDQHKRHGIVLQDTKRTLVDHIFMLQNFPNVQYADKTALRIFGEIKGMIYFDSTLLLRKS